MVGSVGGADARSAVSAQQLQRVIRGDYRVPSRVKISDSCRELLGRILQVDVAKRITIPEILKHKWCALSPCCSCLLPLAVSPRQHGNSQLCFSKLFQVGTSACIDCA